MSGLTIASEASTLSTPTEIFDQWLNAFAAAIEQNDAEAFADCVASDGYWRDILSFAWERPTSTGRKAITEAFRRTAPSAGIRDIRPGAGRTKPRFGRRSGREVVEGWFDFDTAVGRGSGFVRLLYADGAEGASEPPRAWLLLTTLQELHGFEERTGRNRPSGEHYSKIESPLSWRQHRDEEASFTDRDPQVIIVGAGQGGLILAARLRQMGVDALVVEKNARVGDVWRGRYNNLTLHNKLEANHFPYLPFPATWPSWLPKDMLGDWLESYAKFMELNVWTNTTLLETEYDEQAGEWHATLRLGDGSERKMRSKHLVIATGVSGGTPKKPGLPGLAEFDGDVIHSGEFKTGLDWKGRKALIIGTGNSGHDIAQDLYVSGADTVTIMQRGPTCVLSLEPSATISYSIYSDDTPVEDTDLMVAALPHDLLLDSYKWITRKTNRLDSKLLEQLHGIGFKTHTGEDETGFQLLYLRGAGGYYIDVGCSELLINRQIGLVQWEECERFVEGGLSMKDGSVMPLDLVVLATGFQSMSESIRALLGDAVAERVGPIWGFDDNGNVRNMWTQTAQPGLWLMGGAILEARLNSRFLALEIKASLLGLMPSSRQKRLASTPQ